MQIIDLTLPIYAGMPVYPGDPEVEIEQVQSVETDGWDMKRLHINGHDGTHVNAQVHCQKDGKTLDDYEMENFCGLCVLYETIEDITSDQGIIFSRENISMKLAQEIINRRPKFVGLSSEFEFDEEVEILLLQHDIICFERLANTEMLPKEFFFHGAPLKIQEGDGSPIRAYAVF